MDPQKLPNILNSIVQGMCAPMFMLLRLKKQLMWPLICVLTRYYVDVFFLGSIEVNFFCFLCFICFSYAHRCNFQSGWWVMFSSRRWGNRILLWAILLSPSSFLQNSLSKFWHLLGYSMLAGSLDSNWLFLELYC